MFSALLPLIRFWYDAIFAFYWFGMFFFESTLIHSDFDHVVQIAASPLCLKLDLSFLKFPKNHCFLFNLHAFIDNFSIGCWL